MAYATVEDVQARMSRTLTPEEEATCSTLLDDAAVIIDTFNSEAKADAKKVVSCRMVIRSLGDGETTGFPMGASQGSMSGLSYSQSWTLGSGGALCSDDGAEQNMLFTREFHFYIFVVYFQLCFHKTLPNVA